MVECKLCFKNTTESHANEFYGMCAACRKQTQNMVNAVWHHSQNYARRDILKRDAACCAACNITQPNVFCNDCLKYCETIRFNYCFGREQQTWEKINTTAPWIIRFKLWQITSRNTHIGSCEICEKTINGNNDDFPVACIISIKNGGVYDPQNLVPVCIACQNDIGDKNLFNFRKGKIPKVLVPQGRTESKRIDVLEKKIDSLQRTIHELLLANPVAPNKLSLSDKIKLVKILESDQSIFANDKEKNKVIEFIEDVNLLSLLIEHGNAKILVKVLNWMCENNKVVISNSSNFHVLTDSHIKRTYSNVKTTECVYSTYAGKLNIFYSQTLI
jgi:hypothetical protein